MALIEEKVRYIGKAPNTSQINTSSHYVTYSEVSGVGNSDNSLTFTERYGTGTPDIYLNGVRLNASVYTAIDGEKIIFDSAIVLIEGDIVEVVSYDFDTIPRKRNTLNLYFFNDYLTANQTGNEIVLPNLPINANDHIRVFLNGVLKDGVETVILTSEKRIVFDLERTVQATDVIHVSIHRSDDSDLINDPTQASIYYFNNALSSWNAIYYDSSQPTYLSGYIDNSEFTSQIATRDSLISALASSKASQSAVDSLVANYFSQSWVNANIPILMQNRQNISDVYHQPIDAKLLSSARINNLILGTDFWTSQNSAWFGDSVTGEDNPSGASDFVNIQIPNNNTVSGYGLYSTQANDWVLNNLILGQTNVAKFTNSPLNYYFDGSGNKQIKNPTDENTLPSWDWFLPKAEAFEASTYFRLTGILPVWWAYSGPWDGMDAIVVNGNVVSIPETFAESNVTETISIAQDFRTGGVNLGIGFPAGGNETILDLLPAWDGDHQEGYPPSTGYEGGGDQSTARTATPYIVCEGIYNGVQTGILWGQEFTDLVTQGKLSVGQVFSIEGSSQKNSNQVIKGVISSIATSNTRLQPNTTEIGGRFWQSFQQSSSGWVITNGTDWRSKILGLDDADWSQPLILYTPYIDSQNATPLSDYVDENGAFLPKRIGVFHDDPADYANGQRRTFDVFTDFDWMERPKYKWDGETETGYNQWLADGMPDLTTANWLTYMAWDYPEDGFQYEYPWYYFSYNTPAYGTYEGNTTHYSVMQDFSNHYFPFHDRSNSGAATITMKLYAGQYDGVKWGKNVTGNETLADWKPFQEIEGSQREVSDSKYSYFHSEPWTEHPFTAYGGTGTTPTNWHGNSVSNPSTIVPQLWIPDYLYNQGYLPSTIGSATVTPLDSSYYSGWSLYTDWYTQYASHGTNSELNSVANAKSGTYSLDVGSTGTVQNINYSQFTPHHKEDGRPFNINVREAHYATFQDGLKFPTTNTGAGYFLFPFAEIDVEIEDDTGKILTWYSGKEFINKNGLNILQPKEIYYHNNNLGFVRVHQPQLGTSGTINAQGPFFDKWGVAGGTLTQHYWDVQDVCYAGVYQYSYGNDTFTFASEYRDILYSETEDTAYADPEALHATLNNDWIFSPTVTIRGVSYENRSQITNMPTYDSFGGYTTGSRRYKIQLLRERLGWIDGTDLPPSHTTQSSEAYGYGEHTYPNVNFVSDTDFLTNASGHDSLIVQTTQEVLEEKVHKPGYRRLWFMDKDMNAVTSDSTNDQQKDIAYVKANKFADRVEVDWRLVAFDAETIDINPTHVSEHQAYITNANEYPSEQQDLEDFSEQNPVSNYDPTSPNTAYKIIDEMEFGLFGPSGARNTIVGSHFDGHVNTFYGYDAPYTASTSTTEGSSVEPLKTFNIRQDATFNGNPCDFIELDSDDGTTSTLTVHDSNGQNNQFTVSTGDDEWDLSGFSTQLGVPYTQYVKDYGVSGTKLGGGNGYIAFPTITIPADATTFKLKLYNKGLRGGSNWNDVNSNPMAPAYKISIEPVGGSHTFLRDTNLTALNYVTGGGQGQGLGMATEDLPLQGFWTANTYWAPLYGYLGEDIHPTMSHYGIWINEHKLRMGDWNGNQSSLEVDPTVWSSLAGQDVVIKIWDYHWLLDNSHAYWSLPYSMTSGNYGGDGDLRFDPTGNQWWKVLWFKLQYQFEGPTTGTGTYSDPYPVSQSTIHLQSSTGGYSRYNVLGASQNIPTEPITENFQNRVAGPTVDSSQTSNYNTLYTNYNNFHLGSPNLGWQSLPDGNGSWYYEPYDAEYAMQLTVPAGATTWRIRPYIASWQAYRNTYNTSSFPDDNRGWYLFLRRVYQNDGTTPNFVFNPQKWQSNYGPSSIAIGRNLVAPSSGGSNAFVQMIENYWSTGNHDGDGFYDGLNTTYMSTRFSAVDVTLDKATYGFQDGELWEFKFFPAYSSMYDSYMEWISTGNTITWGEQTDVEYGRNFYRYTGNWETPNNQNVQDRTASGYGNYRISRDYNNYQGPFDSNTKTLFMMYIESSFSIQGATDTGLFVEHQEGVRYDGSFTGNVNNSAITLTEPYVVITSSGTHQNGSGLTDGQSFTFQTEGFEQTESIIEMVNPQYTLYETPQSGSERPTSSSAESRNTFWNRACALEFTKVAGYSDVWSVAVDTSASYPSVATDHWNSSAIKFVDDWISNTGGTVTLRSKADGYRDSDHQKAWYGSTSPNYYGSSLTDSSIPSAGNPWDQNLPQNSLLLDAYGYGPDQNTGFANQWLYDLCITKEPLPSNMRPSSEVIIRIDDYQERTQIVDGLKTIIKEIHNRMANHQDQKYIFEYDLPHIYIHGIDFNSSKYGAYGASTAQGAMKSIYEKGLDTDATTTHGRILNDKGEEIEFRNYGPFGYNNFFAREGDYIVTRYMKIKPDGHIYLTFETNTTRYGSIISQGRVTFKL